MSLALLIAAVVFAAIDVWWIALPALFAGIVFARIDHLDRRDTRVIPRPVSQLRRRQLDDVCERERHHG